MSSLAGKVAVVTGASKGIGAAIAKRLAAAGASVVVNYASSKEGADQVVAEIKKAGGKAIAVGANVSKKVEIDHLFAEAQEAFGRLDVLVNNAGIYAFSPLEAVTEEMFHNQFNLNVLGLILTTQKAVELFGPEGGSVINISSVVATSPPPFSAIYSGTKGAVDTVTKALARELGPRKIRVNSLSPGLIMTEGTHSAGIAGSEFEDEVLKQTPLGRVGQPDDIADVAVFLASDDSRWISGSIVPVAGGWAS